MPRLPFLLVLAAALIVLVLLGSLGGAGHSLDRSVILQLQDWRTSHPRAVGWTVLLTHAGGAPFLLAAAALGTMALLLRGKRRKALLLALTVLGGRLGVELIKLAVDRPRPAFDAHPVLVFSQSFPSGHAANSMITYLALALFAVPPAWRRPAVIVALVLALAIGATRPMLGVHWPSDVLGGWIYGILVVPLAAALSQRGRSGA